MAKFSNINVKVTLEITMSKQHGDYDSKQQKWFCSYWMSEEEWLDVHDYSAPIMLQNQGKEPFAKEDDGDEE